MNTRKIIIRGVLLVIGLPVVLFLIAGISYYALMSSYARNRINGTIVSSGQKREYLLYGGSNKAAGPRFAVTLTRPGRRVLYR